MSNSNSRVTFLLFFPSLSDDICFGYLWYLKTKTGVIKNIPVSLLLTRITDTYYFCKKILLLPKALLTSLQGISGFDEAAFLAVHASGKQVTSIRKNPAKQVEIDLPSSTIPWNANGLYLDERPSFTLDPLFHGGAYYVQEASSMFLEEAVKQSLDISASLKVLDLCAAPGGKSTLLQSLITADSLLVSNEVIKQRASILTENMTKWGAANTVVSNNDPKDFQRLKNYFDCIVVDAPCSGSGLFRKDPAAVDEWSENNIILCSQRQQRILADILPALKNGGTLIYSTCSYSSAEDEDLLDWLITTFSLKSTGLNIDARWGIVPTTSTIHKAKGYRFYPDKIKGEGFFITVLKKEDNERNEWLRSAGKNTIEKITTKEAAVLRRWLTAPDDFYCIKLNKEIIALPAFMTGELPLLQSALYIKKAGIKLGTFIRDELIPDHELALSTIVNPLVPAIEVDKTVALQYLRKENIMIDTTVRGWVLLRYQGIALGWIKILPNRVNNYYPAAWRILNK